MVWGARFGENVGSSKNHAKSIAMCPESLAILEYLKLIQTPQKYIYFFV